MWEAGVWLCAVCGRVVGVGGRGGEEEESAPLVGHGLPDEALLLDEDDEGRDEDGEGQDGHQAEVEDVSKPRAFRSCEEAKDDGCSH